MFGAMIGASLGEQEIALASIIAGVFALIAGVLAYWAGRSQIRILLQQNADLRIRERRQLARDALIAGRLLEGVLASLQDTLEIAFRQFGPDDRRKIPSDEADSICIKIGRCLVETLVEQIGLCDTDVMRNYFSLNGEIEQYRNEQKSEGSLSGSYKGDITRFIAITKNLREMVGDGCKKAQDVLASTQPGGEEEPESSVGLTSGA
jgi:hypothetical protein